jgi:GTP-binding protein HflX
LSEGPSGGSRAVLVHVDFREQGFREDLEEFRQLVSSAGAECAAVVTAAREVPDARLFVGQGKAQEVLDVAQREGCDLVVLSHALSPAQQRNLERLLGRRVVDRTGLILDIFAQRARSFEGKLQVELAQLRHLSSRLVRGWTHLERQRGGIGLRGPGEKQLETDRRLIAERIRQIDHQLERVRRQRGLRRRARHRARVLVVSLVGYTNTGKSTLFNRLTGAAAYVADQLFATLDPTLRRLDLGGGAAVVLADTVGFIRHLPHDLVAAFRSTLEETREADLLLHVIDAADPEREAKREQVEEVLAAIGADQVPRIEVMNKLDCLPEAVPHAERDAAGAVQRVWLSAAAGQGLDLLRAALGERLLPVRVRGELRLPPSAGRLRARLYALGVVLAERLEGPGWVIELEMPAAELEQLCRREGMPAALVAGVRQGL